MARRPPLLMFALLALAPTAHADAVVYRCVEAGRPVSLQTAPCADGARTASVTPFVREPGPTAPATSARSYAAPAPVARPARPRRGVRTAAPRNECHEVKRARDRWEREAGLRRTYDDLRAWNDRVARACR